MPEIEPGRAQLLGALPYMRLLIIFSCVPPGVGLLCQVGGHVCGDELAEEAAEQPGPLRGVQPHVPLEQPHLLLLPSHQCHRHVAGGPGYVVFSSNLLDFMPCRRSEIQILFYTWIHAAPLSIKKCKIQRTDSVSC